MSPNDRSISRVPIAGAATVTLYLPMLTLGPVAPHPTEQSKAPTDNTARVLGGAALVVGALGIYLALVHRRT